MPLPDSRTIITAEQGTDAWRIARLGVLTGSRCAPVLVDEEKKKSVGRANLLIELAIERVTGKPAKPDFATPSMEQGLEREPDGRRRFEAETMNVVKEVGFVYWVGKYAGCSVDGYLGDFDELVSIKCREQRAHYDAVRHGKIDSAARRQMMHELWITGAVRHHYVSYNPTFPEKWQYRCITLTRAELQVDTVYAPAADAFLRELEAEVAVLYGKSWQDAAAVITEGKP